MIKRGYEDTYTRRVRRRRSTRTLSTTMSSSLVAMSESIMQAQSVDMIAATTMSSSTVAISESIMQASSVDVASAEEKTLNGPEFLQEEREAARAPIHEPASKITDEFPDGGLRAWMVVFGVSVLLLPVLYYNNELAIYSRVA